MRLKWLCTTIKNVLQRKAEWDFFFFLCWLTREVIDDSMTCVRTIERTDILIFKQLLRHFLGAHFIISLTKLQQPQHYWHLGLQCQLSSGSKQISSTLSELPGTLWNKCHVLTTTITLSIIMNIKRFHLLQPQGLC